MNKHEMYIYWYMPLSEERGSKSKLMGQKHAKLQRISGILYQQSPTRMNSFVFKKIGTGMTFLDLDSERFKEGEDRFWRAET
ncbi:hypothetical protein [Paenibacillus sp. XY044]|uniref:hypothetical protein n=1 Tax=Paenibacillus sp. XY044 TaxID=2026089 RepID=UPI0015C5EAF1|nr:hypothetical protein [Paenibacillus sp. XY044]